MEERKGGKIREDFLIHVVMKTYSSVVDVPSNSCFSLLLFQLSHHHPELWRREKERERGRERKRR